VFIKQDIIAHKCDFGSNRMFFPEENTMIYGKLEEN